MPKRQKTREMPQQKCQMAVGYSCTVPVFEGLPQEILLAVVPFLGRFNICDPYNKTLRISRHQLAITPAYTFSDYKSQGQTMGHGLIDLHKPPSGASTPFAKERIIRLLRGFEPKLFTTHRSENLAVEDDRLDFCDAATCKQSAQSLLTYNTYALGPLALAPKLTEEDPQRGYSETDSKEYGAWLERALRDTSNAHRSLPSCAARRAGRTQLHDGARDKEMSGCYDQRDGNVRQPGQTGTGAIYLIVDP
ncbi:hypothetical protein C8F04DRAFT_1230178 [Mycena alexandri]|uniref:Uncharacterized protein n=1 Tax=Mycena alexandri TaxID=1745969 RepID=A0AAD6TDS7_9AGAR|nr:hypothetical protein C8F04DRAFT_1230178 [Mycena alexandri]